MISANFTSELNRVDFICISSSLTLIPMYPSTHSWPHTSKDNMETESLEDGLLAAKSSVKLRDVTPSDSKATPTVVLSSMVALCGSLTIRCSSGFSSPAESGIMEDLGLSVAAYSVFGSILTGGGIVGALVNGKLVDVIGRRATLWFSEIFSIAGWLAIAFAKNAWWLDLGRLSLGFGNGLIGYVVPIYIAEITPKNFRGGFTSANQLMICCGISLMYFIGNVTTWRILALIGAIPCVLELIGLFLIPESPRWLDYTEAFKQHSNSRFLDLFQSRYVHSLIFGGNNAIAAYSSSIFNEADICCWNVLELLPYRLLILVSGPPPVEGAHSHFGLYWHNGNKISVS
nr:sugar transporter erd6-like 11 [Quercus suber]